MGFNFDLINIFILLVLVSNFILGVFIYLSNRKGVINFNFFIFSTTATIWGVSMFLFRSFPEYNNALFARTLYASASMIPFVFLYFTRVFPTQAFGLSRRYIQVLSIPFLLIFSMSLVEGLLIVSSLKITGSEPKIIFHQGYHTIYALYINIYFAICYVILFLKYFKAEGIERVQMAYVILGTLIGTMIGVSTNLVMPYLGDFSLNWLGQIGVISMVGAIAYSIMKHRLFNMKVLATQFIVAVLCISMFTRLLFSTTDKDLVINVVFLIITLIVGIFLIRSVIKEVKLREQVEKLAEDLQKANLGQSNLIHFMNHQVKGRFGNAKNIFAELMTDDYGVMPEEALPLLQKGLEETNMGVDYVQSILHGASAENGTLPYEMADMDMKELVENVFAKQKVYAENKGLKINLNIEKGNYIIKGDVTQLGEAIKNLIDNSINYTMEGSIDVSLSCVDSVRLVVKDTGVGITTEDKQKLFKSGGRGAESLKINVNSTGYGLAFVKGVVEAHHGRVWAESEGKDKGSTFYLELPNNQ